MGTSNNSNNIRYSANLKSEPKPRLCWSVWANAWYLRMSASLTERRAYFIACIHKPRDLIRGVLSHAAVTPPSAVPHLLEMCLGDAGHLVHIISHHGIWVLCTTALPVHGPQTHTARLGTEHEHSCEPPSWEYTSCGRVLASPGPSQCSPGLHSCTHAGRSL